MGRKRREGDGAPAACPAAVGPAMNMAVRGENPGERPQARSAGGGARGGGFPFPAKGGGAAGEPGRRLRRILGANVLLSLVGAGVFALAGEAWLRRSLPFVANRAPLRFVPGVGVLLEPHEEVWHTNLRGYWTISRTNRLGFVDREPVAPERAASSCHLALVGDSFIEAREVEAPVKVQVRLEELAARERPDLDLTTSAFGVSGTSQIHQVPIYDAFVRPLRPKVVVLQAVPNDYVGNSDALNEAESGAPWAASHASAERGADGRIGLLPLPDRASPAARERLRAARRRETGLLGASFLWNRLRRDRIAGDVREHRARWRTRERWRRLSGEVASLSGWRHPAALGHDLVKYGLVETRRAGSEPAPAYAEALELTGFALDEFAARAARDGSHLVLFLHYFFGQVQDDAMEALAEERGIPVVDQYRYITRAGEDPNDADFRNDPHWNPLGHRWAAESLWEYLEARPALCEPAEADDSP